MRRSVLILASVLLGACGSIPRSDPANPSEVAEHSDHDSDHDGDHAGLDDDHDHDHAPVPDDPATRAAAAKVRVLQNDETGCASEALGPVDVHSSMGSTDKALDVLKRRAAVLGADAVIGVDFHHGEGGHEPTHLSGMAVRCKDLLQGRTYDVLGKIDVTGKMGHEDDAFGELRERARQMRADLILDIDFQHGEGGNQPTRVSGTAIRFRL